MIPYKPITLAQLKSNAANGLYDDCAEDCECPYCQDEDGDARRDDLESIGNHDDSPTN